MLHGVVVAALLGERFAARDDSAHAQPLARFQNVVVRVEDNSVRLRPSERFHGERRLFPGDRDGLELGISLGLDFNLHVHVKDIQILLRFADDPESFFRAVNHVLQLNSGTPVECSHCVKNGRKLAGSAEAAGALPSLNPAGAGCARRASASCSKS